MMIPIRDVAAVSDARRALGREVVRDAAGRISICRRSGRLVVPSMGTSHLTPADVGRIAEAFRLDGISMLRAVVIEELLNTDIAWNVTCDALGVAAFNRECSHVNAALMDPQMSSMIVCTTDDFFVVVGHQSFVENALGVSVAEAFRAFDRCANEVFVEDSIGPVLTSVLVGLRDVYPHLKEGESVTIP